ALFRALTTLLLFAPETPLLFMGQEWAASTPFLFFTDHYPELGRLVTEGRRREFSRFRAFADERTRARIPDPQAPSTFEASRLIWDERAHAPHAGVLELYRALLRLRGSEPALRPGGRFEVVELGDGGLALARGEALGDALLLVTWLQGSGVFEQSRSGPITPGDRWSVILSTEEPRFQESPDHPQTLAPDVELDESLVVKFRRPSAVLLRRE
ncbi:MAG: DUF3459 domain-containing protein, partial [Acidobacteria bacterium]|nr:DUF3459 domain-containing protein [Acidobacteriota bacterium]